MLSPAIILEKSAVITLQSQQGRSLESLLQWAIAAAKALLQTDRVLIYGFLKAQNGVVAFESIGATWTRLLGQPAYDPGIDATWVERYKQGHTTTIADVHEGRLTPSSVQCLERLQLQANLVAPLFSQDTLWGLLIAHHCRSPREWQLLARHLLQHMALPLGIASQLAALHPRQPHQKLEQRVQERTQALPQQAEQERLLRTMIQNIHRSPNLEETLTTVLSPTRQSLQSDRVAVYQFQPDWSGSFVAESVGKGWMPLVQLEHPQVWEDTHLQAMQGERCQHNKTFTVNDVQTSGHSPCYLDLLRQFQARAYVIAPILLDEQLWGLLAIHQNSGPREWQTWEVSLLQKLGIQMAIALRQAQACQSAQAQVQELARLNQLKDDFLSTVSHKLRTPMPTIKMVTQMLEISLQPLGVLEDEANVISRYFKILQAEGERELALINDLLDLTRLDAGMEPLQLTTIALQSYLPHLAESFIARAHAQQQRLTIDIPTCLPPFTTDLPYLERIVTELLHNACKYTSAGETITVSAQATSATLELRVSDTGVEVPATEHERIFDKFYRIPHSAPWKYGGTGLGLALVKKLTARLGGQIDVPSGGHQTTFVLTFGYGSAAVRGASLSTT